jgi:hypothetical protein
VVAWREGLKKVNAARRFKLECGGEGAENNPQVAVFCHPFDRYFDTCGSNAAGTIIV